MEIPKKTPFKLLPPFFAFKCLFVRTQSEHQTYSVRWWYKRPAKRYDSNRIGCEKRLDERKALWSKFIDFEYSSAYISLAWSGSSVEMCALPLICQIQCRNLCERSVIFAVSDTAIRGWSVDFQFSNQNSKIHSIYSFVKLNLCDIHSSTMRIPCSVHTFKNLKTIWKRYKKQNHKSNSNQTKGPGRFGFTSSVWRLGQWTTSNRNTAAAA